MKRYIVGALVGAILIFAWQAVAHMFMDHHDAAYKQIPGEQTVLSALNNALKEEGQYLVPGIMVDATMEEHEKYQQENIGKPWALITYHPSLTNNMGMNSVRSFVTAFLSVLLFIALIGRNNSFSSVFLKSLGLAVLMFLFVWYNQNIWMQTPWDVIKGEMIDMLVAWALCGLWLGWWLNRKEFATKNY